MNNRILLAACLFGLGSLTVQAQELGFSIGGHVPNPAAILDIQAQNKGVLIPRLDLETTTTQLQGNNNPEGLIVYNTGKHIAAGFYYWSGAKWELVVGSTHLTTELGDLEQRFETEINNIINGGNGTGTDISYLVSFNPKTNVYSYLKPNATNDGYDLIEIDFNEAVNTAETNTFIREIKKTLNAGTAEEKEVTEAYVYFNENAIKAWKAANTTGNVVDDIDNSDGVRIDVLGVVNNNFKEIFENTVNKEIINEIIKEAPHNVWVEERGGKKYLVYVDENQVKHDVDLSMQETPTAIYKHNVIADATAPNGDSTLDLEATQLKKGDIYYSYAGELDKTYYINMTQDIVTSVQHSKTLQKEIFDLINEYNNTTGGNVFYGQIPGSTDDVLYVIKDGNPERIDISKDILKVIEDLTNSTIIDKILERIEVKVVTGEVVKLNESIDGNPVYRGKFLATVSDHSPEAKYNIEFNSGFEIKDFQSLLSVKVLKGTELVLTSVADVQYSGSALSFKFGIGTMRSTLGSGNYSIIIDFVATK